MSQNIPNIFAPQTNTPISSAQVDENFSVVDNRLDALESNTQTGGEYVETRKTTFNSRPKYAGNVAPAANEFVDRKFLEASRGCAVGDGIWSLNPNAPANDYGIEWAKMQGQQLSQTAYSAFYTVCQAIGGTASGRYNPAAGASAGNFVCPNFNGRNPVVRQGSNGALANGKTPNFANANNLASLIGEVAHKQATNEVANHPHNIKATELVVYDAGSNRRAISLDANGDIDTDENQTAANVQTMNIVQPGFMIDFWVRIK